jgi:hypothetical protein
MRFHRPNNGNTSHWKEKLLLNISERIHIFNLILQKQQMSEIYTDMNNNVRINSKIIPYIIILKQTIWTSQPTLFINHVLFHSSQDPQDPFHHLPLPI